MAEYGERVQQAEEYKALSSTITAKYVIVTGSDLLVVVLPSGPHLVIWEKEADATSYLADRGTGHPELADHVVQSLPLDLINTCVEQNRDLSVLWHMSDDEQSSLAAEAFLSLSRSMVKFVDAEAKCIKHPSLRDHVIQLLERKRQSGVQISASDLQCPLTCPYCGHSFTLLEPVYRAWRDGDMEFATCKACNKDFKESPFSSVACSKCDHPSGLMPPAFSAYFSPVAPYVCIDCQSKQFTDRYKSRLGTAEKQSASGCVLLITTLLCTFAVLLSLVYSHV